MNEPHPANWFQLHACSSESIIRMDAGLLSLNEARRRIVASKEWDEVNKEVMLLIDEYHPKGAEITEHLLEDVSERLQYLDAYKELRIMISKCLAQQFVPAENTQQHHFPLATYELLGLCKAGSQNACAQLLQTNHGLRHCLKAAFNHPLPNALRMTAWKAVFIQHPTSLAEKEVIRHKLSKLAHLKLERQMVGKKLSDLQAEYPATLSMIAHLAEVLKTVGVFWKQENDGFISNRDLLLLIPFVRVWSESGRMESDGGVVEIIEAFIAFLKKLPTTMQHTEPEAQHKAIEGLCLKVSKLLRANDLMLYRHLEEVFIASNKTLKASPVYKNLALLLHPSVEHMLVADLPLDVVCYIWDQCFIGHTVQQFQCLHYFITVWLTIIRDDLMTCKTTEDLSEVLKRRSGATTIAQFQGEIERSYLYILSVELQITPIQLSRPEEAAEKRTVLLPCSSTPQERPHSQPVPTSTENLARDKEKKLDAEKEHLRLEVHNLRKELGKQHKALTLRVEKVRLGKYKRKQEVQMLHQEIAMLRKKVVGKKRPRTPWSVQGPRRTRTYSLPCSQTRTPRVPSGLLTSRMASAISSSISSETTNESLLRGLHQTEVSSASSARSTLYSSDRATYNVSTIPSTSQSIYPKQAVQTPSSVLSSNASTKASHTKHGVESRSRSSESSECSSGNRPASEFILEDAQEIWLRIFRRFTNGLYMVCHGVQELTEQSVQNPSAQELDVSTINIQRDICSPFSS